MNVLLGCGLRYKGTVRILLLNQPCVNLALSLKWNITKT